LKPLNSNHSFVLSFTHSFIHKYSRYFRTASFYYLP